MNSKHSVSLVRGLSILSSFSADHNLLGITELADRLQLNKSTVHRYVDTLKDLGYLEQDAATKKYRLSIRVMNLGFAVLNGMELRQIASPYLADLATQTGHTVNLAVLDGNEIIIIERIRGTRIINIDLHVGSRLPAYCTSVGKVLLAHLPQQKLEAVLAQTDLKRRGPNTITDKNALLRELARIREIGFALNNEELGAGLRAAAAPIISGDGEVVAAVDVAVHTAMISTNDLENVLAHRVVAAAKQISDRLGHGHLTEKRQGHLADHLLQTRSKSTIVADGAIV